MVEIRLSDLLHLSKRHLFLFFPIRIAFLNHQSFEREGHPVSRTLAPRPPPAATRHRLPLAGIQDSKVALPSKSIVVTLNKSFSLVLSVLPLTLHFVASKQILSSTNFVFSRVYSVIYGQILKRFSARIYTSHWPTTFRPDQADLTALSSSCPLLFSHVTMGFDLERFEVTVDSELKCAICCGVFDQPVQAGDCEHIFCHACIHEWLATSGSCPIDRRPLDLQQLQPAPRIVRNLLGRLQITCEFRSVGCHERFTLDQLAAHRSTCHHNPDALRPCPKSCGAMVTGRQLSDHNCVRELRDLLNVQLSAISDLRSSVTQLFQMMSDHRQTNESNLQAIESLENQQKQLEDSLIKIEQPIQQLLHLQRNSSPVLGNTTNLDSESKFDVCNCSKSGSMSCGTCAEHRLRKMIRNQLGREVTVNIYVGQVEQSVSANKLREYVSSHDVHVLKCELAYARGSLNDFRLTIAKSDTAKLLQPNIWPHGVTCFVMGRFYETKVSGTKMVEISTTNESSSASSSSHSLPVWMTS